ncbi:sensor histidine kinase [Aquibacillus koreensis]|uniref:Sensor histidine kinase n=1 Tax=Aquibacillus koreensis TaxID=279446 RepID=A0A9X3WQ59_9BACI|nr:sensor histidine kinase [Aquibacillus koreensis]MCT2537213.1 sensor histidine kinase [Aquibacillus koreensis]MDC3421561.1 sensor histidine kinase [Aquibacillus koreensis]
MNIKNWVSSSLRTKMLVMFVMLTVTPLIFVGIVSYSKSFNIVSEQSHTLAELQAEQLTRDLDVFFQDMNRFNEIGKQAYTIQFLVNQNDTPEEAEQILNTIDFYRESYQSSQSVLDIHVVSINGKSISDDRGVYKTFDDPLNNPTFKHVYDDPTTTIIQPTVKNSFSVLSWTSPIIGTHSGNVIGFITIFIDSSAIESQLANASIGETGSFYIQSNTGELLFESRNPTTPILSDLEKQKLDSTESGYFTSETSPTFFVYQTSFMTGWKIIGHAPNSEIMKDANEIRTLIVLSVLSSIVFTIGLYFFISNKLILPIRLLKDRMKEASAGNLDVTVKNNGNDEIAELGNSFNLMLEKIKSLLYKSVNEEKQLKIAEFRAMQAQINPHFLYNTLETIIWMAETKNSSKVIEVTKALSQFCRISLSKGSDWITIEKELEHVKSYLTIQKIRYEDILEVTYYLNEDIFNYRIMKLILQPLVENAIYHGIKNKRGKGFIRIKGDFDKDGNICIDVIDNGIGVEEPRLEEIREHLESGTPLEGNSGGFGMVNVQERIRLYYGEPYGITISSWYGSGTRICLTIPAEELL